MKIPYIIASALVLLILTAGEVKSQDNLTGQKFGFTASLQGGQMDIIIPVFSSDNVYFAPAVGFSSAQEGGSEIRIGIVPRFYINRDAVSGFISARVGALITSPSEGEGQTDVIAGIGGGGEYFFSRHLSCGVEAQLNASFSGEKSMRFGNPGKMNLNTATAVFVSVYF